MFPIDDQRLLQQLTFLNEIDKLKTIFRKTNLTSQPDRLENSAEHSWHLAFYVLVLSEYSNVDIDLLLTLKMVLLHDIVEIDAGDTFIYDEKAFANKYEKEQAAATRLFGLLPADIGQEFKLIWEEFEEGKTPEAKFAGSVDRIQPILHNYITGGGSWKRHNIIKDQVNVKLPLIGEGSNHLLQLIKSVIDDSVDKNILRE